MRPLEAWLLLLLLLLTAGRAGAEPPALPAPAAHLGFVPGVDGHLPTWQHLRAYYRALAAASPRVALIPLGQSTEGRPMIALLISSAENIVRREALRQTLAALADPRSATPAALTARLDGGRAAVLIGCGLHSNETASPLTAVRLAAHLAGDESQATRRIRDQLVVILVPSLNPDGTDAVTRWYAQVRGTSHVRSRLPFLYQRYADHDLNRDWYMLTQPETRAVTRLLYRRWFAQVVLDIHEMGQRGARMFVPPFVDPIAPEVDPLLLRWVDLFGNSMALALARAGRAGVVQGVTFDGWWHGGMRNTPWRHNVIGLLTETARVDYATPVTLRRKQLRGHGRGLPRYTRRYRFPDPWPGGTWRLADVVGYQTDAVLGALDLAARHRRPLLADYLRLGQRAVARGTRQSPYAYVLPAAQHDPSAARRLIDVLRGGAVEVEVATRAFEVDGRRYAAGSHVVRMAQPYRAHALSLLEAQRYPELRLTKDGPPARPYDIAGWTLPLQMGVEAIRVEAPFAVPLTPRAADVARAVDPGGVLRLPCADTGAHRAAQRLLAAGVPVGRASPADCRRLAASAPTLRPGDFVVAPHPARAAALVDVSAERLDDDARTVKARPTPVRLALYVPHLASKDTGWTRWVLDQHAIPYTPVDNATIRAGRLIGNADVLLIADLTAKQLSAGNPASLPPRYKGGLGSEGAAALVAFVAAGGRLICLNRACSYAIKILRLPVSNALTGAAKADFACPGSILRVRVDVNHPLAHGGRPDGALMFAGGPAFDVARGQVVARYPPRDLLASGWLQGEKHLAGKAAVVVVPQGRGEVVLLGCRPQFRGQSHRTFRWLFNAIWPAR